MLTAGGQSLSDYANPGVGWPMFFVLFSLYFGMGYLLLGSIFLAVGSLASHGARSADPVDARHHVPDPGVLLCQPGGNRSRGWIEYAAMAFPLSSPFAMVARAAAEDTLWPHLLALGWQALWVAMFVRGGASLFRRRVMKSGPRGAKRSGLSAGLAGMFSKGKSAAG